ncbi:cell division protein FtsK [Streptomyces spongiicola]|uniref:Cell division protein FtsK n=1 Tax=Streptomyces spongiicola TaxID=1690221 RepID=A0A388SWV0_9ACTN|nr:ATP-binding protein [Streptomyces spongiicola]GBQ01039.1 cell division protein FtsK [Streptomyces spongiicola]
MTVVELFKQQPERKPAVWRRYGRRVGVVVTHERTRAAGRLAARHGMYAVGGTKVVARRAWDGRTAARYERFMRAAEAAGNMDLAKEWEERGRAFRAARHQRRMDLLTAPQRAAKGALVGAAAGTGGLVALGGVMAVHSGQLADVAVPLMTTVELIHWLVVIAGIVWGPAVALGPWLLLAAVWAVGRHQQTAPQWALPARERDHGGPIIPSVVVVALRDLGVATLKTAIKDMGEAAAQLLSPITLAGCGVEVDVTLPIGVSTFEVMSRRQKLAENLNRHEHEVYVSVAPAARTVRLWIADSGALDEPIGPSPLVLDETLTADYKNGRAPWGVDLRGDAALISLYQKHVLVTGLSNQGKTASLRALALWLALDAAVEFRLADLKGVGDWAMWDGLATVLIQGPTDEHVVAATEMVEGVFEEMQRRLQSPGSSFPPLVCIVDEAQVAYGCGAKGDDGRPYGGAKATSRYFRAVKGIHDQGRAVNVTIWEGTQDPTNENLPKRSREGNHIRAALALGTEAQAKMALGEAPVEAGAAPHKLRQGVDKGQLVVAGEGLKMAAGQVSVNVRTHFIDDDQAQAIAERAKALRSGVATVSRLEVAAPVDALDDIAAVLGNSPRLRTQEVLQRLAERNPDEYREWTFPDLKGVLEAVGAAPYKSDGVMVVSRERVLEAIAERDDEEREAVGR